MQPHVEYIQVKKVIPQELLQCQRLNYTRAYFHTQKDVANYILDLHSAYMDCYMKLQAIRELQ